MKLKKGCKVEILSKLEVPSGAWRCAEIICGNGHNYSVKYDGFTGTIDDAIVERVPRKAIRPCPPLNISEIWAPGDVVEVFDNFSWKMAIVSKILGRKHVLVRLLGSSHEFKVSKFDLRVRQSWQDDNWLVIGEGFGSCDDGKDNGNLTIRYNQHSGSQVQRKNRRINLHVKDDSSPVKNKVNIQESNIVPSKTLKRGSSYCYSQVEAYARAAPKFRAIEQEGRRRRMVAPNPSPFHEQVDAVASPPKMPVENYAPASFINGTTKFSEMAVERRKPTGAIWCSRGMNLESNTADSVTSSVGSCSVTSNNSYQLPRHLSADHVEDIDGNLSDAESFCRGEYEDGHCLLPTNEELAAEIHRLELHAYRCTMEALHASGPLSWEQETLVTNLRLSLHISNDEHLTELRNLVSADS